MVQIIANRYQIHDELGKGGMGTVYRGVDTQSNQPVAIKQLQPNIATPELIERFIREGTALRDLNHPNIVKMLDAIEESGQHYLVMEYISGGDLKTLLEQGEIPIEQVLKYAIDLADALTRAHKLDIIHRDLKPANVLIADDGTLRLTDFGIAHIGKQERVTETDAIVGTVDYLSPESLDGEQIDTRADIWSFGVMLFEVLAGERPFSGESITQTLMAIMTQPVPDLEALCPSAPIALVDLVYRMLEKDPMVRIRSIRYVGAELEDILHGRTTHTPPETRFESDTPDFLNRPKHNLPAQTTPFVGREAELREVAKLIDDPKLRLITIVASGGMGKTRLALESAENQLNNFDNGVYLVELAPLSDPANIIPAIAEAIGYQSQSDERDQKQQLLDYLANKKIFLVLDNFEHLMTGAPLVTDILKSAPEVQILATSRERLNQSGETLFNLGGMDFPEWETPDDALEYAAVKLFMQSAKRVQPNFEVTTANMNFIARICRLVQGMPLGILLAASWIEMLAVEEIADEIARGIDFLESDMSDLPDRHRSIRAVFDYSWNLMTDVERDVFMKLSVFRGGFTREAAQDITGANLRNLMSLMNKSLVRRDAESGRYEIHELLRQYGETIFSSSTEKTVVEEKHAKFFISYLVTLSATPFFTADSEVLRTVESDFENVRVAWRFYLEREDVTQLRQSIIGFWTFFDLYTRSHDALELFEPILEKFSTEETDTALELRGLTLALIGWFMSDIGFKPKALELMNQGYAILEQFGEIEALLPVYFGKYIVSAAIGEDTTSETSKGLALARTLNLEKWETVFMPVLAYDYYERGDLQQALQLLQSVQENGLILLQIGGIYHQLEKYEQANTYYLKSLSKLHRHRALIVEVHGDLTATAVAQKNYNQAREYLHRGLQLIDYASYIWLTLLILHYGLYLLIAEKYYILAIEILSLLQHHPQTIGRVKEPNNQHHENLKTFVSLDEFNSAYERGKSLDLETVVRKLLHTFEAES